MDKETFELGERAQRRVDYIKKQIWSEGLKNPIGVEGVNYYNLADGFLIEEETAKKFIVAPYLNRDYYTIINTDWPVLDVLIWVESTKQPLHRQIMLDAKAKAMAMSGGERGKVFKR